MDILQKHKTSRVELQNSILTASLRRGTIHRMMKNNEALKNIFLYAALAVSALFLRGGCKDNAKGLVETIYVPRNDTVTSWILPRTTEQLQELLLSEPRLKSMLEAQFKKVIYRHDTIEVRDKGLDVAPLPVDTPVLILLAEHEWTEDVRLFEGKIQGENGCLYKYLVGVQFDSLQFVAIEGDCKHETQTPRLDILETIPVEWLTADPRSAFRLGAKVGWSPQRTGLTYGLHSTWKGVYGATNYSPATQSWMFEAGILFPIGRNSK